MLLIDCCAKSFCITFFDMVVLRKRPQVEECGQSSRTQSTQGKNGNEKWNVKFQNLNLEMSASPQTEQARPTLATGQWLQILPLLLNWKIWDTQLLLCGIECFRPCPFNFQKHRSLKFWTFDLFEFRSEYPYPSIQHVEVDKIQVPSSTTEFE
jgi:hypothetical protein